VEIDKHSDLILSDPRIYLTLKKKTDMELPLLKEIYLNNTSLREELLKMPENADLDSCDGKNEMWNQI
jgi:hypothetical protein